MFERIAEEKIRQAIREGKFDNLSGSGRLISWEEDPLEPPELRMANKLLKNNGFLPAWMEIRKEILAELYSARQVLVHTWEWRQRMAQEGFQVDGEWRQALERFLAQIATLNGRIFRYNLQAPSPQFHMLPLDSERELDRLTRGPAAPGTAQIHTME